MCFTLRLHMSAAPPQGGLTQALGGRMIRAIALTIFITIFMSGCDSVPSVTATKSSETSQTMAQRAILIGTWKGGATSRSGGSRSWTTVHFPDGTVRIDFQETSSSGVRETHSETGIWGTSAGVYFTATRGFIHDSKIVNADTTNPSLYDVYRINKLTNNLFEYQNLSTGNLFTIERVTDSPVPAP
jgi:uncharacterized protein YceK